MRAERFPGEFGIEGEWIFDGHAGAPILTVFTAQEATFEWMYIV